MGDLRLRCAFLAILLAQAPTAAQASETVRVARGLALLPGQLQAERSPDGNSLILLGDDGVVVIDTGRGGEHTRRLINLVSRMDLAPVAVINTHWHLDHVGGNALFRERWPELHIHAHPSLDTALDGFHADYRKQLESYLPTLPAGSEEQKRYQAELDLLRLGRKLAETDPLLESTTLTLGGRRLEIHVSAHSVTEGDLWILDPATKTLIAGDLVTLPVPMFDSACPEGWSKSLADLSGRDFKQLVPGHGMPMTRAQFSTWRKAFDRLLACSANGDDGKTCIDGWFTDAGDLVSATDEAYGRTLLAYYIDQFIKPAAPGRKRWCPAS